MGSCLQPSPARCRPVRLADVPEGVRVKAAREVCRKEHDPDVQARVLLLALRPGETVAWVRP